MICGKHRGLTASETLLVAVVGVAVAVMIAGRFIGAPRQESRRITIERMNVVMDGLQLYALDNGGVFPTTEQGLRALLVRPEADPPIRWRGPYVEGEEVLVDGWGMPLHYICPGGEGRPYDLWSNGADRAEGGEEENADMQSWNRSTLIP
jgi:general secretion pathway protein G